MRVLSAGTPCTMPPCRWPAERDSPPKPKVRSRGEVGRAGGPRAWVQTSLQPVTARVTLSEFLNLSELWFSHPAQSAGKRTFSTAGERRINGKQLGPVPHVVTAQKILPVNNSKLYGSPVTTNTDARLILLGRGSVHTPPGHTIQRLSVCCSLATERCCSRLPAPALHSPC